MENAMSKFALMLVLGIIIGLLIGVSIGVMALKPPAQPPKTISVTSYKTIYSTKTATNYLTTTNTKTVTEKKTITEHLTSTRTTTRTITEVTYAPIKVPFKPDLWEKWPPTTILNPDFQYDSNESGVIPCTDWCGYAIWMPKLSEEYRPKGLYIVLDGTETVVILHAPSSSTPARIYQPLYINASKRYIITIRARNIADCSPGEDRCGDSILVLKLTAGWDEKDIEIARITLDTRKGWIERSYDITNLIRKSDYLTYHRKEGLAWTWLVIEAWNGGPRDNWWGEHIAIDYVKLEVL